MNSDYRLLSTTRNIFCCGSKEDPEGEDGGQTIDQLIKSLHNQLIIMNYQNLEIKLQARKYAQSGDKDRAISELTIYNSKINKYKQYVKVFTKACLFRDSIEGSHDLAQMSSTMRYAVDTHPIIQEWDSVLDSLEVDSSSISEKDYADVFEPDMEIVLPDVPTHVPKVVPNFEKVRKTKIHAN